MPVNYYVQLLHVDRPDWANTLVAAIAAEVSTLGLHEAVAVVVGEGDPPGQPATVVFFGSAAGATDRRCRDATAAALQRAITVLPVVEDLQHYQADVPAALSPINGYVWDAANAGRLAQVVLRELGIEERHRKIFISHKRDDGLLAAEHLANYVTKHGFDPFIDRFDIAPGIDVQSAIADALEDFAFVLLLETPLAYTSRWVYDELDYALSHYLGLHIVTWPDQVTPIPGSVTLRRQQLQPDDLTMSNGFSTFTDVGLDRTLAEIEAGHAYSLVRRRRNLLLSAEVAAKSKGLSATPAPGWRLIVEGETIRDVVNVCPRLPRVVDLWDVDMDRAAMDPPAYRGLLVHAARSLSDRRKRLLTWAAADRPLGIIPENAVGAWW